MNSAKKINITVEDIVVEETFPKYTTAYAVDDATRPPIVWKKGVPLPAPSSKTKHVKPLIIKVPGQPEVQVFTCVNDVDEYLVSEWLKIHFLNDVETKFDRLKYKYDKKIDVITAKTLEIVELNSNIREMFGRIYKMQRIGFWERVKFLFIGIKFWIKKEDSDE